MTDGDSQERLKTAASETMDSETPVSMFLFIVS
jgi:hypothetical protein